MVSSNVTPLRPGRPAKEVEDKDLRIIESMAGRGSTLDDIALVIGVSASTLDRWLKLDEVQAAYRKGRAIAKHEMSGRLWDIAMSTDEDGNPSKGAVTAAIFWLKAQAGWTENPKEEATAGAQVVVYIPDNGRAVA